MNRALLFLGALVIASVLGLTYGVRLADHRGFRLVPVEDAIAVAAPDPRRTVVVVFDGLGRDDADTLPTIQALANQWPCLDTDVGPITYSRPSYAQISTGLEMDRTGVRNNVDRSPAAAESIWQVAKEAGRETRVSCDLLWWHELFPSGIPAYSVLPDDISYFTADRLGKLSLIHPMYVDDAGHDHGGQSDEFRAALSRADRELASLLPLLDLERDLLVVTADHGHTLRGGHGGREPRVAHVRTCFAGAGVAHGPRHESASTTIIAPAIALLSGLRFPRHMRASHDGHDDLDLALSLADLPAPYLADRRAAIARFRAANPDWPAVYAKEASKQNVAIAIALAVAALVASRRPWSFAYLAAGFLALLLVHRSFDLGAIRGGTLGFALKSAAACTAATAIVYAIRRDIDDLAYAVAAGLVLAIAHPMIFGLRVGFPLPSTHVLFFPAVQPTLLAVHSLFGLVSEAVSGGRGGGRLRRDRRG
ncbi:MAG: alkaline phosphatase family protein [Polyangiales bacterium]